MDIAYKVAEYLAANGFGTLGTSIYVGSIPTTAQGLNIVRSGGSFNNYLPIEEAVLDIYSKDTQAADAILRLENIKRFIHRQNNISPSGVYIFTILMLGDVEDIQRDDSYDKIYKITVQVIHRSTGVIS
jgi:hypothetical protein